MRGILLASLLVISYISLMAQDTYTISGTIRDGKTGERLPNVAIAIRSTNIGELTDENGYYELCHLKKGDYELVVSVIGYKNDTVSLKLSKNTALDMKLYPEDVLLKEVVVASSSVRAITHENPATLEYTTTNFSKILSNVSGVTTMDIGATTSKPIVRGLGFNRVAVVNRGITVQNQQWGIDHGLEMNVFDLTSVTIYKGANSLLYGSDAMAGVIDVRSSYPSKDYWIKREANVWVASNNDMIGGAVMVEKNSSHDYFRIAASYQDYADYRVPANDFTYLSTNMKIYDKRLKNTAGKDRNLSASYGIWGDKVQTLFYLGETYKKTGFFSGAHGFPDPDKLVPDDSKRNVDMPNTTASHITFTNNTYFRFPDIDARLQVNTGIQYNHRQENSYFHTHYSTVVQPVSDEPNLELDFKLRTYSSNARLFLSESGDWKKTFGIAFEYQQNRVGGYNFFLPRFNQVSGGAYMANTYKASDKITYNGGLRYDLARTDITGYYDEILAQELTNQGKTPDEVSEYAQRAYDTKRNFGSISGALGFTYKLKERMEWTANVGKSFRFPTAVELAANGIHHAAFRHEVGNPDMDAENGYSFDTGIRYYTAYNRFSVEFSPFINYFSNFIYLEPSKIYSLLPHAGQKYIYKQAEAIFAGAEYNVYWQITNNWRISSRGEYVYNQNLDNDYPLPFTPPLSVNNEIRYDKFVYKYRRVGITHFHISASHSLYGDQNRIAQGEEKTAGTNLFALAGGFDMQLSRAVTVQLQLRIDNIFDTRYMNHLSFYRKLNIPEQGRNIQLFLRVPFSR